MKYIAVIIILLVLALLGSAVLFDQPTPVVSPTPAPTQQLPMLLMAAPVSVELQAVDSAQPALDDVYNGEPGVVYWSDVPRDWKVCVDEAKVYSNPGENEDWYLSSLYKDEPVMVRELDSSRTFAMINPAEYVKFTDLCR